MTGWNHAPRRLHLGCGLSVADGWVNVDGSWNAWLAKRPRLRKALAATGLVPNSSTSVPWSADIRILDVRRSLPFADGSFDAVYASHLLEHLFHDEATRLLQECHRVLSPGGVVRFVVPDLRAIIQEYVGESPFRGTSTATRSVTRADRVSERLLFRSMTPPRGNVFYRVYAALKDFQTHKWMYDADSLAHHLRVAGFVEVAERGVHDSRITGIAAVEHEGRIANGEGVCVEGMKPRARART